MLCARGKRTLRLRISSVWYYEDGRWGGDKASRATALRHAYVTWRILRHRSCPYRLQLRSNKLIILSDNKVWKIGRKGKEGCSRVRVGRIRGCARGRRASWKVWHVCFLRGNRERERKRGLHWSRRGSSVVPCLINRFSFFYRAPIAGLKCAND